MPNILSRAELLLQAKNYSGTGAWLDESGNSHDAQLGSTAGADANDPEFLAHSGDNYVRLPGASGNYVSSADVNLLDADTAHGHQSKGSFVTGNGIDSGAQESSTEASVGGYLRKFTVTAAGSGKYISTPTGTNGFAVSAATQYTVRARFKPPVSENYRIGVIWYDSGGSYVGEGAAGYAAFTGGEWANIEHTLTSHASAAYAMIRLTCQGALSLNDEIFVNTFCLRAGSDGTFVPSLRIVGDLDLRSKAAVDDATPATTNDLINRRGAGNYGYALRIATAGELQCYAGSGTSDRIGVSVGIATTATHVYRATFDVSSGLWSYYLDDVAKGTDTLATGAIAYTGTYALAAGASTYGTTSEGIKMYYAEVRDGIDGPVVARYDADDAAEPFATQTGATDGRTWTYNRSGSGLYVVDQPAFGFHTDDYMVVADHADLDFAADESLTLIAVARATDPSAAAAWIAGKGVSVSAQGYRTYLEANEILSRIHDGTTSALDRVAFSSARTLFSAALRRDVVADDVEAFLNGVGSGSPTADTTTATLANVSFFSIGGDGPVTIEAFFDGEIMAVALFREALTDNEIAWVGNTLAGLGPGANFFDDVDALGAIRDRLILDSNATEATAPRELVGALNLFLGTTAGDVEGALNEKIGSGYVGVVQACNTLLAGAATVYEENDGLRKLAELYVP